MKSNYEIRKVKGKGRAVFSMQNYKRDQVVLTQEVLPLARKQDIGKFLDNYIFHCGGIYLICLGVGSLLNHTEDSNLWFSFRKKDLQLDFIALKDIRKGEELTIDYEWPDYPWDKHTKK